MVRLGLISLLFTFSVWAKYTCKEVKLESNTVSASEVQTLCFMQAPSYFISEKCASHKCDFIKKLQNQKIEFSEKERPGALLCKTLGGIKEEVTLADSKQKISRCLFTEEKVSISLNLLESWNGKHFSGPSRPLNL